MALYHVTILDVQFTNVPSTGLLQFLLSQGLDPGQMLRDTAGAANPEPAPVNLGQRDKIQYRERIFDHGFRYGSVNLSVGTESCGTQAKVTSTTEHRINVGSRNVDPL